MFAVKVAHGQAPGSCDRTSAMAARVSAPSAPPTRTARSPSLLRLRSTVPLPSGARDARRPSGPPIEQGAEERGQLGDFAGIRFSQDRVALGIDALSELVVHLLPT